MAKYLLNSIHKRGHETLGEFIAEFTTKTFTLTNCNKIGKALSEDGFEVQLIRDEFSRTWGSSTDFKFKVNDSRDVLVFSLDKETLKVGRHYTHTSLNVVEHTILSLIKECEAGIEDYKKAIENHHLVEASIKAYEMEVEQAVKNAYKKHILPIRELGKGNRYETTN